MSDPRQPGPLDRAVAADLLARADSLTAGGDYAVAEGFYRRLIGATDADIHVAALLGLAECRYRQDDEPGARAAWSAAVQGPETPLSWLAWKRLAADHVRSGDLPRALEAYRQAESRAPANERAEIASRLGWLSKELGDRPGAARAFGRSRTGGAPAPVVTYVLLALTVGIGLDALVNPDSSGFWFQLFALDKTAVAHGELYRLFTVVFVHAGLLHLASNMYALYLVGPIVEHLYGSARFLAIYVVSAIAASAASYLLVPADAVGASGAIFGLFGILFVALRIHHPMLGRQARNLASQIGFLIVFNLALGFGLMGAGIPIDNMAHLGGLTAGAWLGLLFVPRGPTLAGAFQRPGASPEPSDRPLLLQLAGVVALLLVIGVVVLLGTLARS
ncbi:MAG: rhomboid family intramembrane serine protease [Candidatus Limnocylindrales bacterium]